MLKTKLSTYGVVVSVTAHGERGPGFDPGEGRLSFLSEKSLKSAMCFAKQSIYMWSEMPTPWGKSPVLGLGKPRCRQFPMIKQLPWQLAVNRGAVGESRTSGRRGKTPWGKPVSAINTVRKSQAASRWGPWKNSAPLPHMAHSNRILKNTSSWPMSRLLQCCAWMP